MNKLTAVAAVMGALAVQAAEISYDTTTTVSTPLVLTEDTTIVIASGKTVTYDANAVISGDYQLTLNAADGSGILKLQAENSFKNLVVQKGRVTAQSPTALGLGSVKVIGGTTPNQSWIDFAKSMTVANDFILPDKQGGQASLKVSGAYDVKLTGTVTLSTISECSMVYVGGTGSLTFAGGVSAAGALCVQVDAGKSSFAVADEPLILTGKTLEICRAGAHIFNVAGNAAGTLYFTESGAMVCGAAGAFTGNPSISVSYHNSRYGNSSIDLGGFDQSFGTISSIAASAKLTFKNSVADTCPTVTVVQSTDVAPAGPILFEGALNFRKSGAKKLTVANAAFSVPGTLDVAEGTLALTAADDTKIAETVILRSGAVLDLGGHAVTCEKLQMLGGTVMNGTLTAEKRGVFVESGTVTVSDDNLAVYYPLDNAATLGRDLSGFANADLIATGTPVCTNDAKFGRAIFLDGKSSLTNDVFPASLPTGSASWSTCIFLKHRNYVGGKYHPIGWGACAVSQANFLQMVNATAFDHIIWSDTALHGTLPSGNFADGWHSLVLTYDTESNMRTMYFDGVSVASGKVNRDGASRTPAVKAQDFSIGGQHSQNNSEKNWEGWLDEAAVYRRALSAEEVASYHANGVAGLNKPIPTGKIDTIEVASGATARICQTIEVSDVTGPGTVFTWGMTATDTISGCPKFVGDVTLAADVTVDVTTAPGVGKENAVKLFEVADGVLNVSVDPAVTVNGAPFAGDLRFIFRDGAYWAYQRAGLMLIFR